MEQWNCRWRRLRSIFEKHTQENPDYKEPCGLNENWKHELN